MAIYKLVCDRAALWEETARRTDAVEARGRCQPAEGPLVVGVDSSTQSTKALVVDVDDRRGRWPSGQAPHTRERRGGPRERPRAVVAGAGATRSRQCGPHAARRRPPSRSAASSTGWSTLDAGGAPGAPRAAVERRALRAAGRGRLVEELGGAEALGASGSAACRRPRFTVTKWAWLARARAGGGRAPPRPSGSRTTTSPSGSPATASPTAATPRAPAGGRPAPRRTTRRSSPRSGLDPALLPRVLGPARRPGTVRDGRGLPLRRGHPGRPPGTGDNVAAALGLGLRAGAAGAQPRHLRHRLRRLRSAGPPTRPASSRASPTPAATGCRWPAPSTARSPSTRSRRCWAWTARPSSRAAASSLLPFLDGERTPNLPHASGLLHGLRHDTTAGQLLQAAYDGAVFTRCWARSTTCCGSTATPDPDAPLLLIGGGARGTAWRRPCAGCPAGPVQVPARPGTGRPRRRRAGGGAAHRARTRRGRPPLGDGAGPCWSPLEQGRGDGGTDRRHPAPGRAALHRTLISDNPENTRRDHRIATGEARHPTSSRATSPAVPWRPRRAGW